ncbi:transglycosylase SLT domain-containing protein [Nostoc sp. CHAB 5834]|nr:transglycosylase SLT domain-containing protein [Nostoc sp. CHAB 5834]
MPYSKFIQKPGAGASTVVSWSHYDKPIPADGKPHGFSRKHGDASPEVQKVVIDSLLKECAAQGLSKQDAAHVLAIARIESGFNPDAAAATSSASGLGQFIDRTGKAYDLDEKNRFDIDANAKALVDHYIDNKAIVKARGLGPEHIYKMHHDGPFKDSGGLALAKQQVMPYVKTYGESSLLSNFANKAKEWGSEVQESVKSTAAKVEPAVRQAVSDVSKAIEPVSSSPKANHSTSSAPKAPDVAFNVPPAASVVNTKEDLVAAAKAQGLPPDAIAALVAHRMGERTAAPENLAQSLETLAPSTPASTGLVQPVAHVVTDGPNQLPMDSKETGSPPTAVTVSPEVGDQAKPTAGDAEKTAQKADVQEALLALTPVPEGPNREIAAVALDKGLSTPTAVHEALEERTARMNSQSSFDRSGEPQTRGLDEQSHQEEKVQSTKRAATAEMEMGE